MHVRDSARSSLPCPIPSSKSGSYMCKLSRCMEEDPRSRTVEELLLRRCRWRRRPQNLVQKLEARRHLVRCPAQVYHLTRSLYHCIVPNHTEQGVWIPVPAFLRKFSPDGSILLAFSSDQENMLVYRYMGASTGQSLYAENLPQQDVRLCLFERFSRCASL